jgi:hypothetical protein
MLSLPDLSRLSLIATDVGAKRGPGEALPKAAAAKKNKGPLLRIVGRATDVDGGELRHSFLIKDSTKDSLTAKYKWILESEMKAESRLKTLLDEHLKTKTLDDPRTGDMGWAVKIVDKRMAHRRQEYIVEWTTLYKDVPPAAAQNAMESKRSRWEWKAIDELTEGAKRLVREFNETPGLYNDDLDVSNIDKDNDIGAFQWSVARFQPVISLRRAIAFYATDQPWVVNMLIEYTLNRILALRSRVPKRSANGWDINRKDRIQLGIDLYSMNARALDLRYFEDRAENDGEEGDGTGDENEDDGEVDDENEEFKKYKKEVQETLVDAAVAKWDSTWEVYGAQITQLNAFLKALKVLRKANVQGEIGDDNFSEEGEDVVALIQTWKKAGEFWPAQLAEPRLRLPHITNFLNSESSTRSDEAQQWLKLQREAHDQSTKTISPRSSVGGSAYSSTWHSPSTKKNTPPDHVVPVKWLEACRLIIEARNPGQLPAVVLATLSDNSKKGDAQLSIFTADNEWNRSQNTWPKESDTADITIEKRAMLAKTIAWVFSLYWGITTNKTDRGVAATATTPGSAVYSRAWNAGTRSTTTMQKLVKRKATLYERRFTLLSLAMSWQVGNPLVLDTDLLDEDVRWLIGRRFSGDDATSSLIDHVLYLSTAKAPRPSTL